MSRQVEFHVRARGSTDAADQAKAEAREAGYRVQTVASIRPLGAGVPDPHDEAHWVVVLAVRDVETPMSEAELIAAHGGLERPIEA